MPGVPPDAITNLKRGLKGMFFRKKKDKTHPTQATGGAASSAHAGTGAATAAAATHGHHQSATAPASAVPQISEPANVGASQNIDLNPSASTANAVATTAPPAKDPTAAKLDTKHHAEGMSATSGPLNDDLSGVYGGAVGSPVSSPVEPKTHDLSAPAAKVAQMEGHGEATGSVGGEPVSGAAASRATAATEEKATEAAPAAEPVA